MAQRLRLNLPTQKERVLDVFESAEGNWVDGMIFLHITPPITQYHARIFDLEEAGYRFESRFKEGKTWKEYRLISKPEEVKILVFNSKNTIDEMVQT